MKQGKVRKLQICSTNAVSQGEIVIRMSKESCKLYEVTKRYCYFTHRNI